MSWTLADIRQKVRQVTGRYSEVELSNDIIDEYINRYYQYTFPAELKLERNYTFYEFNTVANQQTYAYPSGFTNFVPPATMDHLSLEWFQDPADFNKTNPQQISRYTAWTGDGATTAFTTTASGFPILPESVIVTDNTETFTDSNTTWTTANVNLVASAGGTGTVNYSTGVVTVNFNTAPTNGQAIYLSFIYFNAGRPVSVLAFDDQFEFFPVPDTVYRFQVQAYREVTPLTNGSDRPLEDQWGPGLAYGAARDIHADLAEMERYQEVTMLYKEQLAYMLRKTNQNLLNTRSAPMF